MHMHIQHPVNRKPTGGLQQRAVGRLRILNRCPPVPDPLVHSYLLENNPETLNEQIHSQQCTKQHGELLLLLSILKH